MKKKTILFTGGLGFIGSHTILEFINDFNVVVVDNLQNSDIKVKDKIEEISGKKIKFIKSDLLNKQDINKIIKQEKPETIIHFASLKNVRDSIADPIGYYNHNFNTTINLLDAMIKNDVKNIIFSSSCTVYGDKNCLPRNEKCNTHADNPYGITKECIEKMLWGVYKSKGINVINLRYFNPIGAHGTGLIGENPKGGANNLFPIIMEVLIGKREHIEIFGTDWETEDGTCVRDYIHVMDLATGHRVAYNWLLKELKNKDNVYDIFNLGIGEGVSVKKMINIVEKTTNKKIKTINGQRKEGDFAIVYGSTEKANLVLGWKPKYTIEDAVIHGWEYIKKNK